MYISIKEKWPEAMNLEERDRTGTWEKVKDGNRKVVQLHLNLKRLKF